MISRQEKASTVTTLKLGRPRDAIARERGPKKGRAGIKILNFTATGKSY